VRGIRSSNLWSVGTPGCGARLSVAWKGAAAGCAAAAQSGSVRWPRPLRTRSGAACARCLVGRPPVEPSWRLLRLCVAVVQPCQAPRGAVRKWAALTCPSVWPRDAARARAPAPGFPCLTTPEQCPPTTPPAAAVWWAELAWSPSAGDCGCLALPAVEDGSGGGGAFPATRPWIYLGSPRLPALEQWPPAAHAGTVLRRRLSTLPSAAAATSRRSRWPRPPRHVGLLPELETRPLSRRDKSRAPSLSSPSSCPLSSPSCFSLGVLHSAALFRLLRSLRICEPMRFLSSPILPLLAHCYILA